MARVFDSPFDRLPDEIVEMIFGKLCIGDRVRTRLVSKSWRERLMQANFPVEPEPPWRISFDGSYVCESKEYYLIEMCFESMSEERTYRFKLPTSVSGESSCWWCCCGSSRGWLLMGGRTGLDLSTTEMLLWDPISGTTRKLPPLSTLSFFDELAEHGTSVGCKDISTSIAGVQVFSVGSVECVVAVFFEVGRSLDHYVALCTPLDRRWRVVGGARSRDHDYWDILWNDGKLYGLCYDSSQHQHQNNITNVIKKGNYTVRLKPCDVEVIILQLMCEDLDDPIIDDPTDSIGYNIYERWSCVKHLVQSCKSGELLVVGAVLDLCSYNDTLGQGPMSSFSCDQTREFEVRRLKVDSNGLCSFEKMSHTGDQGIFVGAVGSTSVYGVEADCIHFSTCDSVWYNKNVLIDDQDIDQGGVFDYDNNYDVYERGVFYMRDDKINRTSVANLSMTAGCAAGWFTPKLFSNNL